MSEYTDYLQEVFAPFAAIEVRRMFGSYGLYREGLMFGLVSDDVLYLKADAASVAEFDARRLPPFSYARGGRRVSLSFYQAPEAVFDDAEEARTWAMRAYEAALRCASRKRRAPGPRRRAKAAKRCPRPR